MFKKVILPLLIWLFATIQLSTACYAQTTDASTDAEMKALQLANQLYDELKSGASFESLASMYSDDPGSAPRGGNLGFAKRGMMVKPFEKAALSLKPGEISKPVRTEFGYHLIQMIQWRGKEYNCRHILVTVR